MGALCHSLGFTTSRLLHSFSMASLSAEFYGLISLALTGLIWAVRKEGVQNTCLVRIDALEKKARDIELKQDDFKAKIFHEISKMVQEMSKLREDFAEWKGFLKARDQ